MGTQPRACCHPQRQLQTRFIFPQNQANSREGARFSPSRQAVHLGDSSRVRRRLTPLHFLIKASALHPRKSPGGTDPICQPAAGPRGRRLEAAAPRHTGQADLHGGHACLQLSTSPAAPSHVPAQRGSGPGQLLPLLLVCLAFQLVQMHRGDSGWALALIQAPNSGGELPWVLKCQEMLTPSPRTFREQVQKYKPLEAGAAWQAAKPSLQSGDSNQAGASSQRQPLKALVQLL